MTLADRELKQIVSDVQDDHGSEAVALACLVHVAGSRIFRGSGAQLVALKHLHALGVLCVKTHAAKIGVPWSDVEAAIQALQRAGDTAQYLDSLPD